MIETTVSSSRIVLHTLNDDLCFHGEAAQNLRILLEHTLHCLKDDKQPPNYYGLLRGPVADLAWTIDIVPNQEGGVLFRWEHKIQHAKQGSLEFSQDEFEKFEHAIRFLPIK